jgi:hypothetical protein
MQSEDSHISDQELSMAADGELSSAREAEVLSHLAGCWTCRTRQFELEHTIGEFVRLHRAGGESLLPPAAGPRAQLKAQLAECSRTPVEYPVRWRVGVAAAAVLATAWFVAQWRPVLRPAAVPVSMPRASLTPGATILAGAGDVCVASIAKNRTVSVALRRQVFAEYGISGAEAQAYEVDYLITPALGGADDIHNLWPQSYSATLWNAHVKDALEDRLRELVCQGQLDLATAQREISVDWIGAYKKYFHTDLPLQQ